MAAVFYVSALPDAPMPEGISDKPLHSLAYFGFAVVTVRAVAGGLPRRITFRIAAIATSIAIGYGVTDEIHQSFVPGRVAALDDLLADAGGALIGTAACWAWGILSCSRSPSGTAAR
jgi:VanZ family protein